MAVSFFDWQLYGSIFADPAMGEIFSEDATIAAWLCVEQALARAQAGLNMVPSKAAKLISELRPDQIDKAELANSVEAVGRPIVGLVRQMRCLLPDEAARWVHYGGTTQDVMDTVLALQIRQGLERIGDQLSACEDALNALSSRGAGMIMPGRTNGQYAQPIPFSQKVDRLTLEFGRHLDRLAPLRDRVLQVQLGGPVGMRSPGGDQDASLRRAFAAELDLGAGQSSWQSSRDGIVEAALWLAMIAETAGKTGWTFGNLASSDVGEVRIRGAKGDSSAMPHKNNPRDAEFTEALARLARQRALSVVETGRHEHERSGGAWIAEWMLIPEAFLLTSACLQRAITLAGHVEPDQQRMRDNLQRSRGVLASEAVMSGLAGPLGTEIAHDIVSKACNRVLFGDQHLLDELMADPRLSTLFGREDLEMMIDQAYRMGNSGSPMDS